MVGGKANMVPMEMIGDEIYKDKELIFSYNFSAGNFLANKRRFKEAIEAYTRALKLTPGHEECLTQRSKCYLLLGQHDKALQDSEDALANNPTSIRGIIQKAEALYAQGEFEYALVCFYRGKRLRPDIEAFELGIQKASQAVENSIGEKSGLRFCRVGSLLKQLEEKQEQEAQAATLRGQKRKQTPTEEYNAKKNYGSKILLEELAQDKEFLQKLIHHPELTGTCKEDIVKEATEVLEFMQTRQEFWAQQKPLYARAIQKKMAEGKTSLEEEDDRLRKRIEEKKRKIQANHEKITKMLMDIDTTLQHGANEQTLKMCASAEQAVNSYSPTWLPRRQAYLGVIYSAMGDAHLKLGHYKEALHWHNEDYELSKDNPKLLHSRARALDNLGRTHATFRKYQEAIDAWEERIPLSKSPEKRTWLFHEIGTCYKELGRYETTRFYGTKCVKEARRCEQDQWTMRGLWLLADAETQLDVMDSALKHYDQAVELANKLGFKREAKDIEQAYKDANALKVQRDADKRKEKMSYSRVGVILEAPADTSEGGVRFADDVNDEEQAGENDQEPGKDEDPSTVVNTSGGSTTPDIDDSFDDAGSHFDWTDEDTLPPEEPSVEAIDVAKPDGEEVGDDNTDSQSTGSKSDEDTRADLNSDISDAGEGEDTEVEAGSENEDEEETPVAERNESGGKERKPTKRAKRNKKRKKKLQKKAGQDSNGDEEEEGDEIGGENNEKEGEGNETEGEGDETEGEGDEKEGEGVETEGEGDETEGEGDETEGEGDETKGEGDKIEAEGDEEEGEFDEIDSTMGGDMDVGEGETKATQGEVPEDNNEPSLGEAEVTAGGESTEYDTAAETEGEGAGADTEGEMATADENGEGDGETEIVEEATEAAPDEVPVQEATSEDPIDDSPIEGTSADEVTPEEAPEEVATDEVPAEDDADELTTADTTAAEDAPAGEISTEKVPAEEDPPEGLAEEAEENPEGEGEDEPV